MKHKVFQLSKRNFVNKIYFNFYKKSFGEKSIVEDSLKFDYVKDYVKIFT